MRRFFTSTFVTLTVMTLMVVGLMLAGCGSGGGSSQDASVGAQLAGVSASTSQEASVGTQLTGQSSPDPNSVGGSPVSAGVTATTNAPLSKQLTLAWDQAAGATSYNMYWSTVPGVTPANGTKISSVSSPYVHTGLAAGTTYYYVVTAADSASESTASTPASGTTSL